jgi:serine/threonine protein kinase
MPSTGRQSLNNSVEKLRPAFGTLGHSRTLSQQLPLADEKKDNQGSTRCNDVETTILWREDITVDVEQELSFVSCLGQGSFAKVYEGYDKRLRQRVAIKVIDKRKIQEPKRRGLIQTEVNILARMKQKNIVEFYRLVEDHKRLFIVMSLCGATTVNVFCRQFQDKRLNDEQAYAIFSQIAKGVRYMHEHNVAHRDLKLTNILIDEHYSVKIIDFGFACEANEMHRMYCGTPSYMSPEIVEKKVYAPKPTDVWAMGVILYKLLSGEYAFGAEDHPELKQNIINVRYEIPTYFSGRVKNFLECCFEYEPNNRMTLTQMFEHPWMLKHKHLL